MKARSLAGLTLSTIVVDIASCHMILLHDYKLIPDTIGYYIYVTMQASVMASVYFIASQLSEYSRQGKMLPFDKYITRISFYFYILVPFATKQIIDELMKRNEELDWTDYPTLLICILFALTKYYPEKRITKRINKLTFNLIPKVDSLWRKKIKTD
jgi:hypothetical protein